MAQARGSQAVVALFEESIYATDPGSPAGVKLRIITSALKPSQNLFDSNTLNGVRTRSRPGRGNVDVSGPITTEISAENIGTILKHAIGSVATTGTGPYSHVLTQNDLPVGMVVEHDYGSNVAGNARYNKFNGVRVASLALDFPNEGLLTATFNLKGAKSTLGSSPLDATLTDNGHTPFTAFQGTILEGGSSIAYVTAAKINLDNDIDDSVFAYGGSGQRRALPEGFSTVTGSITALFESAALLEKAVAGTASSLKITLSRGDGLGSAGNESIEFLVGALDFNRTGAEIQGPRGISIEFPFTAYASTGLQVTIKNALSAI